MHLNGFHKVNKTLMKGGEKGKTKIEFWKYQQLRENAWHMKTPEQEMKGLSEQKNDC